MNHSELRRDVVRLTEAAGRAILNLYRSRATRARSKDDGTPVTEADLASEEILGPGLSEILDIPILSEETKAEEHSVRASWTRFWLVDPLDGTREFLNRTSEFCVSIALVEDGRPTLGVIHAPMLARSWSAARGQGVQVTTPTGERPVHRRPRSSGRKALVSRSHRSGGGTDRYLSSLGVDSMLGVGSAIKFGRMAEGWADMYVRLGPTMEWDVAAGEIIVAEQGLELVQIPSGAPLDYNTEKMVNPAFIVRDPRDPELQNLPEPS